LGAAGIASVSVLPLLSTRFHDLGTHSRSPSFSGIVALLEAFQKHITVSSAVQPQ